MYDIRKYEKIINENSLDHIKTSGSTLFEDGVAEFMADMRYMFFEFDDKITQWPTKSIFRSTTFWFNYWRNRTKKFWEDNILESSTVKETYVDLLIECAKKNI